MIYAAWQPRGDIGAIANSSFDKTVTEKMFIGANDRIAPDTQLIGKAPA